MVERMEVLTDGGSALYGSDAIAGVVNVIMRTDFEGLEVYADAQQIEGEGNQFDKTASVIWGWSSADDRANLVLSGEYFERDEVSITASSLWDSSSQVIESVNNITPVTSFGFLVNNDYLNQELTDLRRATTGSRTAREWSDPLCGVGNDFFVGTRSSSDQNPASNCQDNVEDYSFISRGMERETGVVSFKYDISDTLHFYSMYQYAHQDTVRTDDGTVNALGNPYVLPPIGTLPGGPGTAAQLGAFAEVAGNTIPIITNAPAFTDFVSQLPRPGNQGFETNESQHDGLQLGFQGEFEFADRVLEYDVGYSWSRSDLLREDATLQRDRMELAVNGLG
jgi:outer membrane receptor protein involved in Fe transport